MYTGLLHTHSMLRYVVLALILIVVVRSLMGWVNKRPFDSWDNKLSLWMLIATHTQLLLGVGLYFTSSFVQFNSDTMKEPTIRYWTVEHLTVMLMAVALITIARVTSKKQPDDVSKHRRLFILTTIALLLIVGGLGMSGRGIIFPVTH